ncbi:Leu/Phe/Val dehydrogenase [Thermodesulfobacteriota bacterium]
MKANGIFEYMKRFNHENLLMCQDDQADFKAIIAIHSTALGPAAGGTRLWNYDSEMDAIEDALRLSRGMTYKYAAAGLNFGGGKIVVMADPKREDREVLFRTLGKFINRLGGKLRTGQDVGTTLDDMEYLYMETPYVNTLPQYLGGVGPISPSTAFGVIQGMKAGAKEVFGSDDLKGKVVAIQGIGSVGSSVVEQLHEIGANLIITDINQEALDNIAGKFGAEKVGPDEIYDVDCDIFCPCALGGILNEDTIPRLKCKLVCGAANNQLKDETHGDLFTQKKILYAPDYIVNAGGAVYDADRLVGGVNIERATKKVARIYQTTQKVFKIAKKNNIPTYRAADVLAEERIKDISGVKRYWENVDIR